MKLPKLDDLELCEMLERRKELMGMEPVVYIPTCHNDPPLPAIFIADDLQNATDNFLRMWAKAIASIYLKPAASAYLPISESALLPSQKRPDKHP